MTKKSKLIDRLQYDRDLLIFRYIYTWGDSDVIVTTRRRVVGILNVNKNRVDTRKYENEKVIRRLPCFSTNAWFHTQQLASIAYANERLYNAAANNAYNTAAVTTVNRTKLTF